ncbi:MAG: SsrA-binding protein SmpB [Peptostreptococcaceae bacterium]|nr:SsrA-binding protein SmpB [Peptostreptococcaceae bacterium]
MEAGESMKVLANNKKARHDYFIEETYETGMVLKGTEVKSIRMGRVNLKEGYAELRDGEVFLLGVHVSPYEKGNIFNTDPLRPKKLLLHKREIRKLIGYTTLKGYALVPLRIYLNEKGLVKLEIGVGRGKKLYDKRETIAKKDAERRMLKEMRKSQRGD